MEISDKTLREVEAVAEARREWSERAEKRLEAARAVLWHIGDPRGYEPGGFTARLLDAWTRADGDNDMRLRGAFPELGEAVQIARTLGADALAEWAGIQ